jgi:hypothetical protein
MSGGHGFAFVLDEELCDGNLVAVIVTTPDAKTIQLWAEVELIERATVLRQFAIYGVNATTRELGPSVLRSMAQAAMEEFDVDCIRIEEARRTSGASPGRTIRSIAFRRRSRQADPDAADLAPPG